MKQATPAVMLILLVVDVGCRSGDDEAGFARLGSECAADADCGPGGLCQTVWNVSDYTSYYSLCTHPCQTEADCHPSDPLREDEWACGVGTNGQSVCVALHLGVDVDGVLTVCQQLDETYCDECGCPDSLRCDPGVGCLGLSDVGGACRSDDDCKTGNCSTFANVCRVPIGTSCDATNCDRCLQTDAGFSFCSRACRGIGCGEVAECLGSGERYFCYPQCDGARDDSCPGGTCDIYDKSLGGVGYYCACSECDVIEPTRALGEACLAPYDDCAIGGCHGINECSGVTSGCATSGYCSTACTSTADCEVGACVDIACAEGEVGTCGMKCLIECDGGTCPGRTTCQEMRTTEGALAEVCERKRADGAECWSDTECQSLTCWNNRCSTQTGANGEPCSLAVDCASGNCQSGTCRGTALRGDGCSTDYDCSVGTCCGDVCDTFCG